MQGVDDLDNRLPGLEVQDFAIGKFDGEIAGDDIGIDRHRVLVPAGLGRLATSFVTEL